MNGPVPGMLNWIVSGVGVLERLACVMARRSDPVPLSLVLVTVYVFGFTSIVTVAGSRLDKYRRWRSR